MRWTTDRLAGGALALFALGVVWESRKLPLGTLSEPGPGYMPTLLALSLLGFTVLIVVAGARAPALGTVTWVGWRHAVAILGACAFTALGLERLGYRLTIFVALLVLVKFVEGKGWVGSGAFALGFSFGSFYLFNNLLRVPLPLGPFQF